MSLEKNIVGSWGSELADDDYACALAALGALESSGAHQHTPTSDPGVLAEILRNEFVAGERTAFWRGALFGVTTRSVWYDTIHTDAAALASAWRQYRRRVDRPRTLPRMAVSLGWRRTDFFDVRSLCEWLAHPTVGLGALTFEAPTWGRRVHWHWPLRVGVLAGPGTSEIIAALDLAHAQHPWIGDLSRRFELGSARETCDLLLVTSLDNAAREPGIRVRTSLVVCLYEPPADLSARAFVDLSTNLTTTGVAWVGKLDTPQRVAEWYQAVIREVSHDVPIAATLTMAARQYQRPEPFIVGQAHSLDRCRILAIADRQDRIVVALGGAPGASYQPAGEMPRRDEQPTFTGRDVIEALPLERPPPLRGVVGDLADQLRMREFVSEDVDGRQAVDDLQKRERLIDETLPLRWIQADGGRPDATELAARSFAKQQWNLLAVHIGPTETPRSDVPFRPSGIDFSHGDVTITVQVELADAAVRSLQSDRWYPRDHQDPDFSELRFLVAVLESRRWPEFEPYETRRILELLAQLAEDDAPAGKQRGEREDAPRPGDTSQIVGLASSTIRLPPVGTSTAALFKVRPDDDASSIEGRIAILHGNRVVQTARLSIDTAVSASDGRGIIVVADQLIHTRDDDLDERRDYDVAIRISDVGGKLHLAIQRDDAPTPVELSSLKKPIAAIRSALKSIAEKWDYSQPALGQAVFDTAMFTLAANGKALEQHLRKLFGGDIDRWERIHLLPYTNEFLPLEYLYAGPPPQVGSRVCRNMVGALQAGSCDQALSTQDPSKPACPNQQDKAFVCPMQFWGFRRLIERSGTGAAVQRVQPATASTCVPSKHPYGRVSSLLFAASDRTFNYATSAQARADERAGLIDALGALSKPIPDIYDWDGWRGEVKKQPNLLVLVVHSDNVANVDVLEIGNQQFLGSYEILPDITGATNRPLLLMLLGCSVAGVHSDFQPYPELFHDAGASIVLAPIALLRGVDAVRIAKSLAKVFAQRLASPEPTSFGALLPLLRRELLAQGYPGMMGLVGFGDGDWVLGGP